MKAIGIKNLNCGSKVKELVIQYKLEQKYPNPNVQPKKNIFHLDELIFFKTKI